MNQPQLPKENPKLLRRLWSLVAIFLVLISLSSCYPGSPAPWDRGSDVSNSTNPWTGYFSSRINTGVRQAEPGQTVNGSFSMVWTSPSQSATSKQIPLASDPVTITWTPPPEANNFLFSINPASGGPPFVWQSLQPTDSINVQYNMPSLPEGKTEMTLVQTLQTECNGYFDHAVYPIQLSEGSLSPRLTDLSSALTPEDFEVPDDTTIWSIGRFVDPKNITFTTSVCQDWLSFMQSDAFFMAIRLPVSTTAVLTTSYPVPISFGEIYSNTLQMGSYLLPSPAITVPLELRPERFTFLANSLPQETGEMWFALGVASEPDTCPPGLYAPPNNWGMLFATHLDLKFLPDNCAGCIFPIYRCYEGDTPPGFEMAFHDPRDMKATSYQGEGISCLGPQSFRLRTYPPSWSLSGATSTWITPTQVISLPHYINTSSPVTVTLSYTSSLPINWEFYGGTSTAPNLSDPITGPFKATGMKFFWLLSEPLPASIHAGPYDLIVTATSTSDPEDSRWRGDLIWVGDWVEPPGSEPRWLYLPVIRK